MVYCRVRIEMAVPLPTLIKSRDPLQTLIKSRRSATVESHLLMSRSSDRTCQKKDIYAYDGKTP